MRMTTILLSFLQWERAFGSSFSALVGLDVGDVLPEKNITPNWTIYVALSLGWHNAPKGHSVPIAICTMPPCLLREIRRAPSGWKPYSRLRHYTFFVYRGLPL